MATAFGTMIYVRIFPILVRGSLRKRNVYARAWKYCGLHKTAEASSKERAVCLPITLVVRSSYVPLSVNNQWVWPIRVLYASTSEHQPHASMR
jgi:hypothetical protein